MISFKKKVYKIPLFLILSFVITLLGVVTGVELEVSDNNNNEIINFDNKMNSSKDTEQVIKEKTGSENESVEKRFPKLGFNLPIPTIPGLTSQSSTTNNNFDPNYPNNNNNQNSGNFLDGSALGTGVGLTSTAFLIKKGILGGLTAIKVAILPPLFIGAIIIFLIAGAVFFTCNVVSCGFGSNNFGGGGGGLGSGFGGLPSFSNLFNRNGYDYYEPIQPVYQAIDEGYKKFE